MFQSSSDPKAGCYQRTITSRAVQMAFQSSSDPKAGCYHRLGCCLPLALPDVSILIRPEGRMLRPSRTLPATFIGVFQSSSDPKAGCYSSGGPHRRRVFDVSILIRPEGRMLPAISLRCRAAGGCFNPHPTRRPDATGALGRHVLGRRQGFNPHPTRRPDAT